MKPKPVFQLTYKEPDPEAVKTQVLAYAERRNRTTANRENAKRSTGPRTPEGKQRSALNAIKHGLTSQHAFLPWENFDDYKRHHQEFIGEYQPKTPTERQLTRELADTAWRQNRIVTLESALVNVEDDISAADRAIRTLSYHSQRLHKMFHTTLDKLRALLAERRDKENYDLDYAASVYNTHKELGIPYEPSADGFVYSKDTLEQYVQMKMRHGMSKGMRHLITNATEFLDPAHRPAYADYRSARSSARYSPAV